MSESNIEVMITTITTDTVSGPGPVELQSESELGTKNASFPSSLPPPVYFAQIAE